MDYLLMITFLPLVMKMPVVGLLTRIPCRL